MIAMRVIRNKQSVKHEDGLLDFDVAVFREFSVGLPTLVVKGGEPVLVSGHHSAHVHEESLIMVFKSDHE